MRVLEGLRIRGVQQALGAALLFGAATPLAKRLLQSVDPWQLAGLFYLGSGIGLSLCRRIVRAPDARMPKADVPWLIGAIAAGGIVAPVLLMLGLTRMPASGASMLLNAEGVFTALLAWFAVKEHVSGRIAVGMPTAIRALTCSLNANHAKSAVNTPSAFSSIEAPEAGIRVKPSINRTGATMPPAAIAPISHGTSAFGMRASG